MLKKKEFTVIMINPLSVKTLTEADLGHKKTSHQTHIGLPEGCFDNWSQEEDTVRKALFFVSGKEQPSEVNMITNAIKPKDKNKRRSPKIKTGVNYNILPLDRHGITSIVKEIRKECEKSVNPVFILRHTEENPEVECYLIKKDSPEYIDFKKEFANLFKSDGECRAQILSGTKNNFITEISDWLISNFHEYQTFDPKNIRKISDEKFKRDARIKTRKGIKKFRSELMSAYENQCALTGFNYPGTLDACHIFPYCGVETNHITNGMIMRSDIHRLWDRRLLALDDDYRIICSGTLKNTNYSRLENQQIFLPNKKHQPSKASLAYQRKEFEKYKKEKNI